MPAKTEIASYEARVKPLSQIVQIAVLFLFSGALLATGFLGWGNLLNEAAGVWFAKSGACVTALTIVIGHKTETFDALVNPRLSLTSSEIEQVRGKWGPWANRLRSVNLFLGVLSAVVWGYGDTFMGLVFPETH